MPSKIWCIFPSSILTASKNVFIIIFVNSVNHFKPLATRFALTYASRSIEFFFLFLVLPGFSNNTADLSKYDWTKVVAVLRLLFEVAVQHVARILSNDIRHLHDAHERGECATLVDVSALAQPHDVFVLGVLEGS